VDCNDVLRIAQCLGSFNHAAAVHSCPWMNDISGLILDEQLIIKNNHNGFNEIILWICYDGT
jgi:hypothetical protein